MIQFGSFIKREKLITTHLICSYVQFYYIVNIHQYLLKHFLTKYKMQIKISFDTVKSKFKLLSKLIKETGQLHSCIYK